MGIEDSFILPLIVVAICKADFSIIFFVGLYTYFLCRQKVPKSSAHGRFLNAKRS